MSDIAANLKQVEQRLRQAEEAAGKPDGSVKLVAVSKTFGPPEVRAAEAAGQRLFGENRVQEAEEKIGALRDLDVEWHLIGPLQSNKAARAVQLFDVIETLDRPKIVRRLARYADEAGKVLRVLVQVNVGGEEQKSGVAPERTEELIGLVEEYPSLSLEGLMTIPPYNEDPEKTRPYFRRMAELLEDINSRRQVDLQELSMGMSGDFETAIEEGATLVRIGTAIFGQRS